MWIGCKKVEKTVIFIYVCLDLDPDSHSEKDWSRISSAQILIRMNWWWIKNIASVSSFFKIHILYEI
jgi:hypothetical protein